MRVDKMLRTFKSNKKEKTPNKEMSKTEKKGEKRSTKVRGRARGVGLGRWKGWVYIRELRTFSPPIPRRILGLNITYY